MTETCRSDTAAQVRQRLTTAEVAEFYGFRPNPAGFIRCPFHTGDNHGSLKLYPRDRGWHCFGCHAGGDVIDFVAKLFDLPFKQALAKLDADFSLRLTDSVPDMAARSAALEQRRREQRARDRRLERCRALSAEYLRCWEIVKYFPPELREDGTVWVHPLYPDAVKALPRLEAEINELMEAGIG